MLVAGAWVVLVIATLAAPALRSLEPRGAQEGVSSADDR
jgi:hypothetical protein